MELKFEVYAKIRKPIAEVFDAIYNPKKLSGYFTTGGASGPLDEGEISHMGVCRSPWSLSGFHQTSYQESEDCSRMGYAEGSNNRVEISFEALDTNSTLAKIKESGWKKEDQKSLDASYGNCMGWMQMLCCLKVYVEYGINLREFMF